ncbi:MAG TPA: hypothetical protein VHZ29_12635 [Rhizomicrobium sp.]|jgi:hypothetical protein|nr:hypothetical protein [Rhizomicrobium sp.]
MTKSRFGVSACAGTALLLLGCVNNTALDDLHETKPVAGTTAFNKALFDDYRALARSFGEVGAAAGVAFDSGGSMEMTEMDSAIGALANSYAEKALIAARGSVVEPEPGVDVPTHKMRDRLVRAMERGKDSFPADSARAQAQYDCWLMNGAVPAMAKSSKRCLATLENSLKKLESEAKVPPPTPVAPPADNTDKPAVNP